MQRFDRMGAAAQGSHGVDSQLRDVNTDQQLNGLQATLVIDRDTAARLGVSILAIDNTLNDAFGQRQVSNIYKGINQYHVVLEVLPQFQRTPDTLSTIYASSSSGKMIPFSAFAHFEPSFSALTVNHQGIFPAITLSFNLEPGASLGPAVEKIEAAQRELGMPPTVHGTFQGTAQAFQDSLSSEGLLIISALAAVYIVLGILYESYIHPITILSTLPSAGVGALLAIRLFDMDLSIIALIGIILLIGLVKKNAILMVDFAVQTEREGGKSSIEAIYEACLLRFRPIMMTTMAALLGALAAGVRHWYRRGTASPTRHHHRRRPDRQPDADAVHDSGGLSLPRSAAELDSAFSRAHRFSSSRPNRLALRSRMRWPTT